MSDVHVSVLFSFVEDPEIGLEDESKRWGEGQIELYLEKLPETAEEWQEISRVIGMNGNYPVVAINKIIPLDQVFVKPETDIVQGEIVDE